tara:strand:+ start:264 stop:1277 length:1014 start_codon:yes stop_codon:yes gene_type:complete
MAFLNIFFKTLGLLFGISIFLLILSFLFSILPNQDEIFELKDGDRNSNNIIATIELNGPILESINSSLVGSFLNVIDPNSVKEYLKKLEEINPKVLIFKINSPGGTVGATDKLEKLITNFKINKDIKIFFYSDQILASGGYWVATAGDKIFANYGSLIGSIGVSGPSWYFYDGPIAISNGLLGRNIQTKGGIKIFDQHAGYSKDLYNPFRRPTSGEINHLQNLIEDIYDDFLSKVSKSRKIEYKTLKDDIGALVFNSNQAKENFLIDEVIDFDLLLEKIIKENSYKDFKILENKNSESIIRAYIGSFFNLNNFYLCKKTSTSILALSPNFLHNCFLA